MCSNADQKLCLSWNKTDISKIDSMDQFLRIHMCSSTHVPWCCNQISQISSHRYDKSVVSHGVVNQNPPIFVFKKFDQSDCPVSLGKWCHRDDRDTTWPITKYFCKHTVLNITTYKKIRVKWIFVYFMNISGNCRVYKTKQTLECTTFLELLQY